MNKCESCVFSNYWKGKDKSPLCNLGYNRLDCNEGMTGRQYSNNRLSNISTAELVAELARREGVKCLDAIPEQSYFACVETINDEIVQLSAGFGPCKIIVVVD